MPETRTEQDSMGTLEVPADALYGASTQRAVVNFPISGERVPPLSSTPTAISRKPPRWPT